MVSLLPVREIIISTIKFNTFCYHLILQTKTCHKAKRLLDMDPDGKVPISVRFCIVCIAGPCCGRPHCPNSVEKPLDLTVKSDGFKKPTVLKRPTSLPIGLGVRTHHILDRDLSGLSKMTPKASVPFLPRLNPHPYGRILATGMMKKDKQGISERWVFL